MNWIDVVILAVMGFSALIAMVRGFVREILDLCAWTTAGMASVRLYEPIMPKIASLLPASLQNLSMYGAMAVVFITVLVVLCLISSLIAGLVRDSPLAGLDHALGFCVGAARGALLVCIAYIGLGMAEPVAQWPAPVNSAKLLPYVYEGSHDLVNFMPKSYRPKLDSPVKATPSLSEVLPFFPAPP